MPIGESVCDSVWEYGEFPLVEATDKCAPTQGKVKISPLRFVDVVVNGKAVRALKDSGAQIPLISRICCGIVDLYDKEYDVILPAYVVSDLQHIPTVSVSAAECVGDAANTDVTVPSVQVTSMNEDAASPLSDHDVINAQFVNRNSQSDESMSEDANRLLHEQQQDEMLSDCWSMARQSKGNFVIFRGLLYRKDKVECQPVCQLCVPTVRRDTILKLAHDSVYSGHLGERKTRERIKLFFIGQR